MVIKPPLAQPVFTRRLKAGTPTQRSGITTHSPAMLDPLAVQTIHRNTNKWQSITGIHLISLIFRNKGICFSFLSLSVHTLFTTFIKIRHYSELWDIFNNFKLTLCGHFNLQNLISTFLTFKSEHVLQ